MNLRDMLETMKTAPRTHRVTAHYACGKTHTYDALNAAAAENYATTMRRKMGRDLIDRDTGKTVRVVDVTISRI